MEKKFHVSSIISSIKNDQFQFLDVQLGFHSFLALLRSMPDVVRIEFREDNAAYRVHPVYDQTTAHIQKMVWEQRDKFQHQNRVNPMDLQAILSFFYFD